MVVATILIEIQGDETKTAGLGTSIAATRDVLTSVASGARVDGGRVVNAAEVFWVPGDGKEVVRRDDVTLDFPELLDL